MPVTVARTTGEVLFEDGRLLRGAERPVRKVGPRQYAVAGTRTIWFVNLDLDVPCECPDAQYRHTRVGVCLHEASARLQEGEPLLLEALQRLLARRADHEAEMVGA